MCALAPIFAVTAEFKRCDTYTLIRHFRWLHICIAPNANLDKCLSCPCMKSLLFVLENRFGAPPFPNTCPTMEYLTDSRGERHVQMQLKRCGWDYNVLTLKNSFLGLNADVAIQVGFTEPIE